MYIRKRYFAKTNHYFIETIILFYRKITFGHHEEKQTKLNNSNGFTKEDLF